MKVLQHSLSGDGTLVLDQKESVYIKPQLNRCSPSQGLNDLNVMTSDSRVRTHCFPMAFAAAAPPPPPTITNVVAIRFFNVNVFIFFFYSLYSLEFY